MGRCSCRLLLLPTAPAGVKSGIAGAFSPCFAAAGQDNRPAGAPAGSCSCPCCFSCPCPCPCSSRLLLPTAPAGVKSGIAGAFCPCFAAAGQENRPAGAPAPAWRAAFSSGSTCACLASRFSSGSICACLASRFSSGSTCACLAIRFFQREHLRLPGKPLFPAGAPAPAWVTLCCSD